MRFLINCLTASLLALFSNQYYGQINPFAGIVLVDSCNFSTNCSFLSMDTNGLWQQGIADKDFLQSNQFVLITDTLNAYPVNVSSFFELHWPVNDYSFFNFILTFEHSMDTPVGQDGGRLEVSYDYGQTWLSVEQDANTNIAVNTENFYQETDTLFDGAPGFSGQFTNRISAIQWVWILPLKDIPTDTMYYRFHFKSDTVNEDKDGWMLHKINFAYSEINGGLSNLSANNSFDLTPNPSDGLFQIQTQLNSYTLTVQDQFGRKIPCYPNQQTLDLTGFESGIYFVTLKNNDGREFSKKVVIN